jgi:hypothetical protein
MTLPGTLAQNTTVEIVDTTTGDIVGYAFAAAPPAGSPESVTQIQRWVLLPGFTPPPEHGIRLQAVRDARQNYNSLADFIAAARPDAPDGIWKPGSQYVHAACLATPTAPATFPTSGTSAQPALHPSLATDTRSALPRGHSGKEWQIFDKVIGVAMTDVLVHGELATFGGTLTAGISYDTNTEYWALSAGYVPPGVGGATLVLNGAGTWKDKDDFLGIAQRATLDAFVIAENIYYQGYYEP